MRDVLDLERPHSNGLTVLRVCKVFLVYIPLAPLSWALHHRQEACGPRLCCGEPLHQYEGFFWRISRVRDRYHAHKEGDNWIKADSLTHRNHRYCCLSLCVSTCFFVVCRWCLLEDFAACSSPRRLHSLLELPKERRRFHDRAVRFVSARPLLVAG